MPLEQKKKWLENKLEKMRIPARNENMQLVISREHVLRDSLAQFATVDNFELHKEVKIHFIDEVGQDAGGVIREWLHQLMLQIFDGGLFKAGPIKGIGEDIDLPTYYNFAGQVLGKSLFERAPVPC